MKSNNISKILITILLIIPILILYFNFDIFKIFETKKNKETLTNNIINICEPKATQIYDITNSEVKTSHSIDKDKVKSLCKYHCHNDSDCDFYTIKDRTSTSSDNCFIYHNSSSDFAANIDCNSNAKIDEDSGYSHDGELFIKSDFYKTNKTNFNYIDYELEKTNELITKFNEVNEKLNDPNLDEIMVDSSEFSAWNNELEDKYNNISSLSSQLGDYLDLSRNSLYSELVGSPYAVNPSGIFTLDKNKYNYDNMLYEIKNNVDTNKFLLEKDKQTNTNLEYNVSFYIALIIILIISAIILVIYNNTNSLSEIFLIIYFSSIAFLLLFLHFFFKI